jgi:hypothetical protein
MQMRPDPTIQLPNLDDTAAIFSCGNFLYVYQEHSVTRFDASTGQAVQRLQLEVPLDLAHLSFAPSCCSFYTNNSFICAVVAVPPSARAETDAKYITMQWGALSGRLYSSNRGPTKLPASSPSASHILGRACCYDPVNNVVWNYSPFGQRVGYVINLSSAPRTRPVLSNSGADATLDDMLQFIVQNVMTELPAPTEKIVAQPGRRPYTLEPTISCIEALTSLIDTFRAPARESETDRYRLICVLRIMQAHLFAVAAEAEPFLCPPVVLSTLEAIISDPKLNVEIRSAAVECAALGWRCMYPDAAARVHFWQSVFLPLVSTPAVAVAFIDRFASRHDVRSCLDADVLVGFTEPYVDSWRHFLTALLTLLAHPAPMMGCKQLMSSLLMSLISKIADDGDQSSASTLSCYIEVLVASSVVRARSTFFCFLAYSAE